MLYAVRTSETSVDNHFTRQYIAEDNSEHHTRRRENLKSHSVSYLVYFPRYLDSDIHIHRCVESRCLLLELTAYVLMLMLIVT
jgi:hypothetical protein